METDFEIGSKDQPTFSEKHLYYNGYEIHNPNNVINDFKNIVLNHDGITVCNTCINDVPIRNIRPACGNCQNRMCKDCINSWYNVELGKTVAEGNTKCPYCKKTPKFEVIKKNVLSHVRN